ncbi:MAG: glutaredoxin 3 [Proteobacteria bacterium]|nr:glutaredoxin 3 [Pseudomonadota bacterium]
MPTAKAPQPKVVIYGNDVCAYCAAARMLFTKKGLLFDDIIISGDDERSEEMLRLSGSQSVPQIFINDRLIGGFDELCALDKGGDLDRLIGQ